MSPHGVVLFNDVMLCLGASVFEREMKIFGLPAAQNYLSMHYSPAKQKGKHTDSNLKHTVGYSHSTARRLLRQVKKLHFSGETYDVVDETGHHIDLGHIDMNSIFHAIIIQRAFRSRHKKNSCQVSPTSIPVRESVPESVAESVTESTLAAAAAATPTPKRNSIVRQPRMLLGLYSQLPLELPPEVVVAHTVIDIPPPAPPAAAVDGSHRPHTTTTASSSTTTTTATAMTTTAMTTTSSPSQDLAHSSNRTAADNSDTRAADNSDAVDEEEVTASEPLPLPMPVWSWSQWGNALLGR